MKLRSIRCDNFAEHESFFLPLPDRGIVLIQGPNGAGKSTGTVEAVSFAGWRRGMRTRKIPVRPSTRVTLTGPGWTLARQGTGSLSFEASAGDDAKADLVTAQRIVAGAEELPPVTLLSSLGSSSVGISPREFTPTKTQGRVEDFLGEWDRWRRANVFTSADLAMFTAASDAERKAFFESVLGAERFDTALERVKEKMNAAGYRRAVALGNAQSIGLEAMKLMAQLSTPAVAPPEGRRPEPLESPMAKLAALKSTCDAARRELDASSGEERRAASAFENAERKVIQQHAQVSALEKQSCSTCGQATPRNQKAYDAAVALAAVLIKEKLRTREEHEKAGARRDKAKERMQAADRAYAEAAAGVKDAEDAYAARLTEIGRWDDLTARAKEDAAMRDRVSKRLGTLEMDEDAQKEIAEAARLDEEHYRAATEVLGIRGVRARMLEKLLGTVTALSNEWLELLAPPRMRVSVLGTKTAANGSVSDVITIKAWKEEPEAEGEASGLTYADMSTGQRKRIDVSLLLALGAVSEEDDSTMFFDEVFDSLDASGREGVIDLVYLLAETRCVVVITHDEFLAKAFPEAQRVELLPRKRTRATAASEKAKKKRAPRAKEATGG